jgi:hypothetical protein
MLIQKFRFKLAEYLRILFVVMIFSIIVESIYTSRTVFANSASNSDISTSRESGASFNFRINLLNPDNNNTLVNRDSPEAITKDSDENVSKVQAKVNSLAPTPMLKNGISSLTGIGMVTKTVESGINPLQSKQPSGKMEMAGLDSSILLTYSVTDSIINPTQPLIYISDMADKKLYEVNYETGSQRAITFDLSPERIKYANGKIYVCLLNGQHDSYWFDSNQKGAFAVIDSVTFTKISQFDIQQDPYDIAADSYGNVYIAGGSGQWTHLASYNEKTGALISFSQIRERSLIDLHPTYNKIYSFQPEGTPALTTYNINSSGLVTNEWMGTSNYLYSNKFKISPDGIFIFNGSGYIFTCNSIKEKDGKFFCNIGNAFTDVAFDLENNRFFTCSNINNSNQINVFGYDYFEKTGTFSTAGVPQNIYFRNDKLIAITLNPSNQYNIEKISDSYIKPEVPSNIQPVPNLNVYGIKLGDDIKDTVYDNTSNKAYSIDEVSNHLLITDLTTRQVVRTILLPYKPSNLCISEDKTKIYIANSSSSCPMTELDINTGNVLRNLNYLVGTDWGIGADWDTGVYRRIYNKDGKIYYIDGEWGPKVYVFDALTLNYITSPFTEVGGMAFSADNAYLYYWRQLGWSAGSLASNVFKYSIVGNTYTQTNVTNLDLGRDPLDSPILLLDNKDAFICKKYMFKNSDLSNTVLTFPEPIYAVNAAKNVGIGRNGIYDLTTALKISTADFSNAESLFFDKNNTLFFVRDNVLVPYEISGIIPNYVQRVMVPKENFQLQTTSQYSDGLTQDVTAGATYESSDTTIAQVSGTGLITAFKCGSTNITVKYGNKSMNITVIVSKPLSPVILSPVDGFFSRDNMLIVSGTASPSAKVYVNFEDDSWRAVTADINGDWSYRPSAPLKDGRYSISAKIVDNYGNESDATNLIYAVIDTKRPDPPIISEPSNGISIKNQDLIVFGLSEPYSKVNYYINGYDLGYYVVDQYGFFRVELASALAPGIYKVTAMAEDRAGNISVLGSPVNITISPTAQSSVIIGTPLSNYILNYNSLVFSGLTDPNTLVNLYCNNNVIASVTSDERGYWGVIPTNLLADGNWIVNAAVTVNGQKLFSNTVNITIDTIKPILTLTGPNLIVTQKGKAYVDNGAAANDNSDGDISSKIVVSGIVNINTIGSYTLIYNVQDTAGNSAIPINRTVMVTSIIGDLDGDSIITVNDTSIMKKYLLGKIPSSESSVVSNGDIDNDGKITSKDYALLIKSINKK